MVPLAGTLLYFGGKARRRPLALPGCAAGISRLRFVRCNWFPSSQSDRRWGRSPCVSESGSILAPAGSVQSCEVSQLLFFTLRNLSACKASPSFRVAPRSGFLCSRGPY